MDVNGGLKHLRFDERVLDGVALDAVRLDEELDSLEERRRVLGRLLAEQDLHRVGRGRTELTLDATNIHAAVSVQAVDQLVCKVTRERLNFKQEFETNVGVVEFHD